MLADVVRATAAATLAERGLDAGILPERITLRRPRDPEHGDFATAIAMQVAPSAGLAPGEFAQALSDGLVATGLIASATVAEPGFVNLRLPVAVQAEVVRTVLREGPASGALDGTVVVDGVRARAADGRVMDVSDLAELVGDDVARYELARHPVGATVDVDVDVLRGRTEANPAFAVRYAHARLAAVVRNAAELGLSLPSPDALNLAELRHPREIELTRALAEYPGLVARRPRRGRGTGSRATSRNWPRPATGSPPRCGYCPRATRKPPPRPSPVSPCAPPRARCSPMDSPCWAYKPRNGYNHGSPRWTPARRGTPARRHRRAATVHIGRPGPAVPEGLAAQRLPLAGRRGADRRRRRA